MSQPHILEQEPRDSVAFIKIDTISNHGNNTNIQNKTRHRALLKK